MSTHECLESVVERRSPIKPLPTGLSVSIKPISAAVVLFDIYGTLLMSGCGDVGTSESGVDGGTTENLVEKAARSIGIDDLNAIPAYDDVRTRIDEVNQARQSDLNPRPEIEIVDIWQYALRDAGRADLADNPIIVARLACAVEAANNPTWPMPGARAMIDALHGRGVGGKPTRLGIVSNAQVFTIPLVENLIGGPLESRFDLNLCCFSNRYRASKPGPLMFDGILRELSRLGIQPSEALYVGNDMLNDVWAANQAGIQTALFAGDARSLRLRQDHAACENLSADVVLTHCDQLLQCLNVEDETDPSA